MTARVLPLVVAAAAALFVLLAVLALVPDERDIAVQAYVLFLGAIMLVWLLGGARRANPNTQSEFEHARRPRPERSERLPELVRLERETALGLANAFDLHARLRPRLREVAAHRLATRRGIDLDRDPEAARAVLPPALWEVVRPDRDLPANRFGPGLEPEQLREAVDALERI